jgi:hypothetical protein
MAVRSFALLADSLLTKTGNVLTAAVQECSTDWGLERMAVRVECTRAWDAMPALAAKAWQGAYVRQGRAIRFAWQPEFIKYIQGRMFPSEPGPAAMVPGDASIASEGVVAMLSDLTDCVVRSVALHRDDRGEPVLDNDVLSYGSGALLATIRFGERSMHCLLNHACVRTIAEEPVEPAIGAPFATGMRDALRNIVVSLPVELGQAEVDVGGLMTLQTGDVIRLTSSVDGPVTVLNTEGQELFGGYLGNAGGNVALEVVGCRLPILEVP